MGGRLANTSRLGLGGRPLYPFSRSSYHPESRMNANGLAKANLRRNREWRKKSAIGAKNRAHSAYADLRANSRGGASRGASVGMKKGQRREAKGSGLYVIAFDDFL